MFCMLTTCHVVRNVIKILLEQEKSLPYFSEDKIARQFKFKKEKGDGVGVLSE